MIFAFAKLSAITRCLRKIRVGQGASSEQGAVVFAVLMVCTALLVCTATMVAVVRMMVHIEVDHGEHIQVYNLARGFAYRDLQQLERRHSIQNGSTQIQAMQIQTTVTPGNPLMVQVTATSTNATDTISFAYDTIAKKIVLWQDDGPPPGLEDSSG